MEVKPLPFKRELYPPDWEAISYRIRFDRAKGRCECAGICGTDHSGRCEECHGRDAISFNGRVTLTVAHLNHTPWDTNPRNLAALCQQCHLRYDTKMHGEHAKATRRKKDDRQLKLIG